MHHTLNVLAGFGLGISASMWLSLQAASPANSAVMPFACRRRLHWWQLHSRIAYASSAALMVATLAMNVQVLTILKSRII